MKEMNLLVATVMILAGLQASAVKEVGNAGDMCEKRIRDIRDDISSWIRQSGSAELILPSFVSVDNYNQRMESQMKVAKISCTTEILSIGGAEKTCINYSDHKGEKKIKCNIGRFTQSTSESDQYVLIHHEFAGLAGLEANRDDGSDYSISHQIAGRLESVWVKKLVISNGTSSFPKNDRPLTVNVFSSNSAHAATSTFTIDVNRSSKLGKALKKIVEDAALEKTQEFCVAAELCVFNYVGANFTVRDDRYSSKNIAFQIPLKNLESFGIDSQYRELLRGSFSGAAAKEIFELLMTSHHPSITRSSSAHVYLSTNEGTLACYSNQGSSGNGFACTIMAN